MAESPISIKLRCASWKQVAAIYERDLMRNALFLKSAAPPPLGTTVRINLTLPTQTLIVLNGTIHKHVGAGELDGRGPGVDIKLYSVPHSALWLIESALATARIKGNLGSKLIPLDGNTAPKPVDQDGTAATDGSAVERDIAEGEELVEAESELIEALNKQLTALRKLNPFQVLGVNDKSTDEQVRAAFATRTKDTHPDRFKRYQSAEVHRLASEIFILIRNAYQYLDTEAKRTHTLNVLRKRAGRPPVPARPVGAVRPPPIPTRPAATPPPVPTPAQRPASSAKPPPIPTPEPPVIKPSVPEPPDAPSTSVEPPAAAAEPPAAAVEPPAEPAKPKSRLERVYDMVDAGQIPQALKTIKMVYVRNQSDRQTRIAYELIEGLAALADRDRLEAAQRFEAVLELDPNNERAAQQLADMRTQATNERKDHMARLLNQK